MKQTFRLVHAEARRRAVASVDNAPDGFMVTVSEPTRSGEQNALLHVLLTEIAADHEWAGKKRDVEIWKRLLVASLSIATLLAGCRGRPRSWDVPVEAERS